MKIINFDHSSEKIEEMADLSITTFGGSKSEMVERIKRHMSYPGFIGLLALDENNLVTGFTYGYISTKGQYYRTLLEAALSKEENDLWLEDCFEYVELLVSPIHRNRGIGKSLMTALLASSKQKTAILTTQQNNYTARSLYKKLGWTEIKEPFYPGNEPYVIMGKQLN